MPPKAVPPAKYSVNDQVLCYHGVMLYRAKILEIKLEDGVNQYRVHYQGWNNKWDEFVADERLLEINDENLKKQEELSTKHASAPVSKGASQKRGKTSGAEESVAAKLSKVAPAAVTGGKAKSYLFTASQATPPSPSESGAGATGDLESRASTPSVDGAASTASSSTVGGPSSNKSAARRKTATAKAATSAAGATTQPVETVAATPTPAESQSVGETKRKRARPSANNAATPTSSTLANITGNIAPEQGVETLSQFRSRIEVQIKIPTDLKDILVDDWDLIIRQSKLCRLPATKTVDDILNDYVKTKQKSLSGSKLSQCKDIVEGIRAYFNAACGNYLLYKFERPQYNELLLKLREAAKQETGEKQSKNIDEKMLPISSVYGFSHFLRFFVRFGYMLAYTDLDQKTIDMILASVQDVLKYLSREKANLFNMNVYETAAPEYQRKAYAN